jgi:predicted alpha/beta-fold hydrolase
MVAAFWTPSNTLRGRRRLQQGRQSDLRAVRCFPSSTFIQFSPSILTVRTLIRTPDGGTLGLDMCPTTADAPDLPPDTPIIVVQHGLTGGSYEAYIRSILAPACASKSDGGLDFRAIVVNFRGCQYFTFTCTL